MFFHSPQQATQEEIASGNVKEFTVDKDTPWLPLKGLIGPVVDGKLTVERVRINGVDLPARRTMHVRDFRLTEDKLSPIATDMPMYQVLHGQDGTPVLARNVCSNGGKWQKGATISVWGEWSDIEAQPKATVRPVKPSDPRDIARASVERLSALSPQLLREQAAAVGVVVDETATADTIIPLILKATNLPVEGWAPARYEAGKVPPALAVMSYEELKRIAKDYPQIVVRGNTSKVELAEMIAKAAGYTVEE